MMPAPSVPVELEGALLCPRCSYDVRGRSDRICPECGGDNPPERLVHVTTQAVRMRRLLRRGMWAMLMMWILLVPPVAIGGYPYGGTGGANKWTQMHTARFVLMLLAASYAFGILIECRRVYRLCADHLEPEVAADLRGRFITVIGLMIGPTLLAIALRPFL